MTMYVYLYMCPYLYFVQSVSVTGYTDDDSGQSCLPWDLGRRLALALASHFHRKSPLHFARYKYRYKYRYLDRYTYKY